MSLGSISELYKFQAIGSVCQTIVEHAGFEEFCFRLRRLVQATADLDDSCWVSPLRKLRHYRFDQCAAPIGFGNESVMSLEKLASIKSELRDCALYYAQFANDIDNIVRSLKDLVGGNENPLLTEIRDYAEGWDKVAVLLKESRHIAILSEVLQGDSLQDSVEIISQQQLRKHGNIFDAILCVGSSRWFGEFVFRSPRAWETRVIRYSWMPDSDCRKAPVFKGWEHLRPRLEKRNKVRPAGQGTYSISSTPSRSNEGDWLTDDELIPRSDLAVVAARFASQPQEATALREDVPARLIELEGGRGTWVEATDAGRALVINLDEETDGGVGRVSVSSILPGMFVLLRGDADGDSEYLIPIANAILGKRAEQLRTFQKGWKSKLRDMTKSLGVEKVIAELKSEGSLKANEINLRNWLWPRSIRTEASEDFFAIMRVIGMEDVEEKCWALAKQIDSAHRRAGRRVRAELLRQVREADLSELERLGEMRFELAELGGKPLLALRVVRVSDFTSGVAPHHLNRLFELEEK